MINQGANLEFFGILALILASRILKCLRIRTRVPALMNP